MSRKNKNKQPKKTPSQKPKIKDYSLIVMKALNKFKEVRGIIMEIADKNIFVFYKEELKDKNFKKNLIKEFSNYKPEIQDNEEYFKLIFKT